jgi:hypothetical protein
LTYDYPLSKKCTVEKNGKESVNIAIKNSQPNRNRSAQPKEINTFFRIFTVLLFEISCPKDKGMDYDISGVFQDVGSLRGCNRLLHRSL